MKVYVVNYGWGYEGEATYGVYSSAEKAREAILGEGSRFVDSIHIYEIEVDAQMSASQLDLNIQKHGSAK